MGKVFEVGASSFQGPEPTPDPSLGLRGLGSGFRKFRIEGLGVSGLGFRV